MVEILKKEVAMDFETAVRHVENAITSADMSVLLTKSIDEILRKKLGLNEYPRYTMILACAPHLAKMALDVSMDIGNLFPCSFVVYEENGKVMVSHLSIMKVAVEAGLAPAQVMESVIQQTSDAVHVAWIKI
ncbi:MAG: DUF302 domain-containing protein [Candidatus Bathyarchaeota archaeon]|nr:DUF302 domain-containing protein [Candidatus Bathyarchaeota archaeon]